MANRELAGPQRLRAWLRSERAAVVAARCRRSAMYGIPAAITLIHHLTSGHPGLLQVVLHTLVEQLQSRKTNVCREAFVHDSTPMFLEEARTLLDVGARTRSSNEIPWYRRL